MQNSYKQQTGQSVLIIAFALVALVALLALVVDAGNAYVQRRQIQNAMDSGAQAGALAFAQGKNSDQINAAIVKFVSANGVNPSDVLAYYVVQDASRNNLVARDNTIASYLGETRTTINYGGATPLPIVGVQVEGNKIFPTYFAGVVGVKQMPAGGASAAYAAGGACTGSGLFPIAIDTRTFPIDVDTGVKTVRYEEDYPTQTYTLYQRTSDAAVFGSSSNFGWVAWRGATSLTDASVASDMNNTESGVSGKWTVSETLKADTRVTAGTNIQAALASRVSGSKPSVVVVPVYDQFAGSSSSGNANYRIIGFARLHIISYTFTATDKYIVAKFQRWVDPVAEGGCTNFGVGSVKVRPPISTQRALVGSIKLQKLTLTQTTATTAHVPVDVVNVIDISGSMGDQWGGGNTTTKLTSAKNALKSFNSNLRPDLGDKAALVTYPTTTAYSPDVNDGSYSYNCESGGSTSSHYWGRVRSGLVSSPNITGTGSSSIRTMIDGLSASGYTPIAGGLKRGRETVLGSGRNPNAVAVIIFASDGMTNVRLNGHITGYDGRGTAPTCNQPAEQDALDQANIAKGDTNPADYKPDTLIFTIAIGTDFNPALLQAIATPATDPAKPYYFRATDAATMATIYQQISQRVQQIGTETCQIITSEAFASGALVTVRYPNGTTRTVTTTSNGEFVLTGADLVDGTYTIVSASVTINGITYNVFTDGLGGPALGSSPTVTVGIASGTYRTDLFLKTGTTPSCGN